MSKVFIYCDGGFGNRYNSLLSGLFLAWACNRKPLIIWPRTRWLDAAFTDIFDSKLEEYKDFDHTKFFDEHDPVNIVHWNPWGANVEQHNCMGIYMGIDQFLKSKEHKNIMFYSSLICPWVDTNNLQNILNSIPFQLDILESARSFIKLNFDTNEFNGLHIRRTDHAYQLNEDEFIQKINSDNKLCFVCSDDQEAEKYFLNNSSKVRVFSKTSYVEMLNPDGGWNTITKDEFGHQFPFNVKRGRESVIQAMIDLLILSASNVINTDHRSTFLQTALLLKRYKIV